MSKILFIDVDGTLVDYENHLPESAVRAIRAARAAGHRVYICTGRSKAEVYPPLWEIGLDGMIGGNGSYVEDHGKVVMHQLITPEQARRIADWLHSRKLEFYLESNNGLFASEHFETAAQDAIQEYSRRKGRLELHNQAEILAYKVDEALSKCKKEIDKDEKNRIKTDLANLRRCIRKDHPEKMNDAEETALRQAKETLEASASHLMILYTQQAGDASDSGDPNL